MFFALPYQGINQFPGRPDYYKQRNRKVKHGTELITGYSLLLELNMVFRSDISIKILYRLMFG